MNEIKEQRRHRPGLKAKKKMRGVLAGAEGRA